MKTQALKYNHAFLVRRIKTQDYETAVKEAKKSQEELNNITNNLN